MKLLWLPLLCSCVFSNALQLRRKRVLQTVDDAQEMANAAVEAYIKKRVMTSDFLIRQGDGVMSMSTSCTDKATYLLGVLSEVTSVADLISPNASQGLAYSWMVQDDTIDLCTYSTTLQRYILVTTYYSTDGLNWSESASWLETDGSSECEWFGVTCRDGAVTVLNLEANNLSGTLPSELASLTSMEEMLFFSNELSGTILSLEDLTNLTTIDLEANDFSGTIVPALPTSLENYQVSNNDLTGSLPSSLVNLTSLKQFWGIGNSLSGTLPDFPDSIEILYLGEAGIEGSIPESFSGLSNMQQFFANDNQLTGTIPSGLFQMTQLRLHGNNLEGPVGEVSDSLTNLWLQNNTMTGSIPASVTSATSLENFLIGNNLFTGTLPDVNSSSLSFFDTRNNDLTGTIPPSLFSESITFLYLQENQFTGTLPTEYASASSLRDLYLFSNQLTGEIPPITDGQLTALTEFLVNNNSFTGSMPGNICNLTTSGSLEDLWSDCAPPDPEIQCDLSGCCTRCF